MSSSLWNLREGERVTLDSGAVAEVIAPTGDGTWVLVKYVEAPESPEIVGTEDLCSFEEIVSWTGQHGC